MLSINGYVPKENEVLSIGYPWYHATNLENDFHILQCSNSLFSLLPEFLQKQETKVVKIKIIGCHNLAKKDIFGASDPYVKVSLLNVGDNSNAPIDTAFTKTKKRVRIISYSLHFCQALSRFVHTLRESPCQLLDNRQTI